MGNAAMKTVLLLGATGVFGSRLAANLLRVEGIRLIVASRHLPRAQALVDQLLAQRPGATVIAAAVQRASLQDALAVIKPWVVIDASGPFQGADYAVPRQALAAGCNCIDLADARDYLMGFHRALGSDATSRNLVALSGVSSSPALSSAVVAELTEAWQRIDAIDIAITPDGRGDVGEAVLRGVMSYAGNDVPQFRFGALRHVKGWMAGKAMLVPGLGRRWVAPVDTVEASLFPNVFGVRSRVAFFAGLESRIEMLGIACLARLRARGIFKNLAPLIQPFALGRKLTKMFGSGTGGMVVRVAGINAGGQWAQAEWSLLASEGKGPHVPGLPAVAAVRMLLQGMLKPGARICCGDVPLRLIAREFEHLPITTSSHATARPRGIFDDALTETEKDQLPAIITQFHDSSLSPVWQGEARVTRSGGWLPLIMGWIIGLPPAAEKTPVHVTVEREADGSERWTRSFAGCAFHSIMNHGPDNSFWERFSPLNFKLKLRVADGRLIYPITSARLLSLPVPRFLLPKTEAFETVDAEGRFVFDVKITLPLGGLLVHYRGWLRPKKR
mgnify:CR=1 FL=1